MRSRKFWTTRTIMRGMRSLVGVVVALVLVLMLYSASLSRATMISPSLLSSTLLPLPSSGTVVNVTTERAARQARLAVVLSTYAGDEHEHHVKAVDPMLATWLSSIRTVVVTTDARPNGQFTTWIRDQDAPQALMNEAWSGNNHAESRKLAGLAHVREHMAGTYDWIFVIDDDTYIFFDRVLETVGTLDASLPYALGFIHPPPSECALSSNCCSSTSSVCTRAPFTAQEIAADRYCPILPDDRMPGKWGRNTTIGSSFYHGPSHWPYGGAGFVLSRGAVDALTAEEWRDCHSKIVCDGGDVRVATCLLSKGILFTQSKLFSEYNPPQREDALEMYLHIGQASFHRVRPASLPFLYSVDRRLYDDAA